jgi:hypothetical protein
VFFGSQYVDKVVFHHTEFNMSASSIACLFEGKDGYGRRSRPFALAMSRWRANRWILGLRPRMTGGDDRAACRS